VTNKGTLTVTLDAAKAPETVNNFVFLARYRYFDGLICHRIIPNFMAQCGDPTGTGTGGPGYAIPDEYPRQGEYRVGSIAMANTGQPNSGGSQFFIITGSQGVTLPPSYSLFGQVDAGQEDILKALDAAGNPNSNGVPPLEPITIESVVITER
jgi:cyclophilin family peptidyl-prolyl cis-trans isomerase